MEPSSAAVAALKAGHPHSRLTWVVEPQWAPLLEANPFVDRVVAFRRERFFESLRQLRAEPYDFGAPELVDLEYFLMWRARGMTTESPAVRP